MGWMSPQRNMHQGSSARAESLRLLGSMLLGKGTWRGGMHIWTQEGGEKPTVERRHQDLLPLMERGCCSSKSRWEGGVIIQTLAPRSTFLGPCPLPDCPLPCLCSQLSCPRGGQAMGRPGSIFNCLGSRDYSPGWPLPQQGVPALAAAANWVTSKMPQCHPSLRSAQLPTDFQDILLGPRQTVITLQDHGVILEYCPCTLALLGLPLPSFCP